MHEEGLALESLEMLYKKMCDVESAKEVLTKNRVCYEKWGAMRLSNRLDTHV